MREKNNAGPTCFALSMRILRRSGSGPLRGGGLGSLAVVAGELLARGHARSGDACTIYGYAGNGLKLAKAIRDFASQYADQTEADYAKFMTAIKSKKIRVSSAWAT